MALERLGRRRMQGDTMTTSITSQIGSEKAEPTTYTLLRLPAVLKARGRSRSSHYADIKQGLFTRQVNLGVHCVGWPEHEVMALNTARIAGRSEEDVRALVRHLEARRKDGA